MCLSLRTSSVVAHAAVNCRTCTPRLNGDPAGTLRECVAACVRHQLGPGSGGQHAIGTGVVGGMLTATAFAIYLVPAFLVAVLRLVESRRISRESRETPAPGPVIGENP